MHRELYGLALTIRGLLTILFNNTDGSAIYSMTPYRASYYFTYRNLSFLCLLSGFMFLATSQNMGYCGCKLIAFFLLSLLESYLACLVNANPFGLITMSLFLLGSEQYRKNEVSWPMWCRFVHRSSFTFSPNKLY